MASLICGIYKTGINRTREQNNGYQGLREGGDREDIGQKV